MNSTPSVLVIDDDPYTRNALAKLLYGAGYHVETASDGEDAIQHLCEVADAPDLILLDLQMPGMGGVLFRRVQQQDPRWAAIPVVVITAFATPEQAAQLDVAVVVDKVAPPDDLLAAVERHRHHHERHG